MGQRLPLCGVMRGRVVNLRSHSQSLQSRCEIKSMFELLFKAYYGLVIGS